MIQFLISVILILSFFLTLSLHTETGLCFLLFNFLVVGWKFRKPIVKHILDDPRLKPPKKNKKPKEE